MTALQRLRDAGVCFFSAGDFAGKLARALASTRKQRPGQSRGYAETALVNALGDEGCPVCRTSADHDDRYFFWFLRRACGSGVRRRAAAQESHGAAVDRGRRSA
jgi:hypothetical protein